MQATDTQLDEIFDKVIETGTDYNDVGKYIEEMQNGPTREEREEAERKAREEAEARKKLTHTLFITAVKDQLAAMMVMRTAFGWGSAESRQKLSNLPLEVLHTEDKEQASKLYEQLTNAGVEVGVHTVNGLGEVVKNALRQ